MAVIAGHGADPLHPIELAPGSGAVLQAVGIGLGDGVVHQLQTGVAADEALLRLAAENIGKQALGSRQTGTFAVVAAFNAVGDKIGGLDQYIAHFRYHIQLILARLAAGHVQAQPQRLLLFVIRLDRGVLRLTLRR